MITCQNLKQMAKNDMKTVKPSVFKASLLFFVIAVIISLLISNLSGYNRYINNMNNIMAEVYQKPELMLEPTEEFITELTAELEAAIPKITPPAAVLSAVLIIMNGMLNAGFEGYCLKVVRKQETKARDIMRSFEHFGKVLLLLIIRTLATLIGALFFVVPGILSHYSFSQCFMVLYDNPEYSVFRCLKESAHIMRGHKMMLFVLQLSFIFWHLISDFVTISIGVAVLQIYTKPYIGISQAHFYNLLARPETYTAQQEAQQ